MAEAQGDGPGLTRGGTVSLFALGAQALRDHLATGAVRATEVADACLARIRERDGVVCAWATVDEDWVRAEAERLDAWRRSGQPIGPLHGLPVAVDDRIDTLGLTTAYGCELDAGRKPVEDAEVVARLRAAGALLIGKTQVAELGVGVPERPRQPLLPERLAGSGAAAAVADRMALFAVVRDVAGESLQAASWCGVVGYSPTRRLIPQRGVLSTVPSLERIGVVGLDVEAVALLADTLSGDERTTEVRLPHPQLERICLQRVPVAPEIAIVSQLPGMDAPAEGMQAALGELRNVLGERAFVTELPEIFAELGSVVERICQAESAKALYSFERRASGTLGAETVAQIQAGKSLLARDYLAALDWPVVVRAGMDEVFERCDALVTQSSADSAPQLPGSFPRRYAQYWALADLPVLSLPLFVADDELPMGVNLAGSIGNDARLLRTARWLMATLTAR